MDRARISIGCQGWRYPDWRCRPPHPDDLAAPFYCEDIPAARELWHYARTFDLVEVDSTFYATPPAKVVQKWAEDTPEAFRFALKLPRSLTHEARLQRGRRTLAEFCDTARILGSKLAAVLIQLPPSFGPQEFGVLERFLAHLGVDLPFAVEFRDVGWFTERTVALLRAHRIALVLGDTPWIESGLALGWLDRLPAPWLYLRFMGLKEGGLERFTHLQIDRTAVLDAWAAALLQLGSEYSHAWVLMDNHFQGFSPGSAVLLARRLGLAVRPFPRDVRPPAEQLGLDGPK